MINRKTYALIVVVVMAVGFVYIKNPRTNVPADLRDAVADNSAGNYFNAIATPIDKSIDIPKPSEVGGTLREMSVSPLIFHTNLQVIQHVGGRYEGGATFSVKPSDRKWSKAEASIEAKKWLKWFVAARLADEKYSVGLYTDKTGYGFSFYLNPMNAIFLDCSLKPGLNLKSATTFAFELFQKEAAKKTNYECAVAPVVSIEDDNKRFRACVLQFVDHKSSL